MSGFKRNYWLVLAIAIFILVTFAAFAWMRENPQANDWDEALYFNQVMGDVHLVKSGGLYKIARAFLIQDKERPPAYRILAVPFTFIFGFSPTVVRLVSFGFFTVSLIFVFLATKCIGGIRAGAFAVIFLCLCPGIIWPVMVFGTEYPFFLAIAAMLYFLFVNWDTERELKYSWIGLGVSLGIGAIAKATFLVIGLPVLFFSFILSWRRIIINPSPSYLVKAATLGTLLALPFWLLNFHHYLSYANYAMTYIRHAWGSSFLGPGWMFFMSLLVQSALGLPLTILLILMISALVVSVILQKDTGLDRPHKTALLICCIPTLLLPIVQLTGVNMNPRYFSPALIFLAVGTGVLSIATLWTRVRLSTIIATFLFVSQLLMIIAPTVYPVVYSYNTDIARMEAPWLVMARRDQWDWNQLREVARSYGIKKPSISYLGNGDLFNPPQIEYPWVINEEEVKVKWLWRYEDGPIDLDKIMESIIDNDIILTAPDYVGTPIDKQDLDNQYNDEFARRLRSDPRFKGPMQLSMGRLDKADILVFVNTKYQ